MHSNKLKAVLGTALMLILIVGTNPLVVMAASPSESDHVAVFFVH